MRPSTARVLTYLREHGGQATTHELAQAAVGGIRFSARLHELRRDHGYTITSRPLRPGSTLYRLKPSGLGAGGPLIPGDAGVEPRGKPSAPPGENDTTMVDAGRGEGLFDAKEFDPPRRGFGDLEDVA